MLQAKLEEGRRAPRRKASQHRVERFPVRRVHELERIPADELARLVAEGRFDRRRHRQDGVTPVEDSDHVLHVFDDAACEFGDERGVGAHIAGELVDHQSEGVAGCG
jgi:hypothetical protein